MGYCYNCGKPFHPEDLFCENCGINLDCPDYTTKGESFKNTNKVGYIFTNIKALSQKLHVKSAWLSEQFLLFIERKKVFGVFYSLIDVSEYNPRMSINKENEVRLSPSDSWITHQRLLMDCYIYDTEQKDLNVEYLFIIGGHDIIPMPEVSNHMPKNDPKIDTDLPYAYLYGQQTREMLESGTLFYHPSMLLVGRLPLAEDAVSGDIINYLERDLEISQNGFPNGCLYGQCDPHWEKVSGYVVNEYISKEDASHNLKDYLYRSLVLTPHVTITEEKQCPPLNKETLHISRFLRKDAVIYYFNMHGADFPSVPYFLGFGSYPESPPFPGIAPVYMAQTQIPNIVVTEACYGARFINAKAEDSMLLSSMQHLTMLYVGSSRTSIGAVDRNDSTIYISHADVIAKYFIDGLLKGFDAAQALFIGRQKVIQESSACPTTYMTITEFNLFGDPTLTFYGVDTSGIKSLNNQNADKYSMSKSLMSEKDYSKVEIKEINLFKSDSILDKVRQAVNKNINDIHQKITMHLYAHYRIQPRKLNHVLEIKTNQKKELLYIYEESESRYVWVEVDERNQIKSVSITK